MAIPSITAADFTGLINISQSTYPGGDFTTAIATYTREFLLSYLGNKAYTDINNNARARWTTFFDGTTWTNDDGNLVTLFPVTDIIKYLIYANWVARQPYINTATGLNANLNENSVAATAGTRGVMGVERQAQAARLWEETAIPFIEEYRTVTRDITSATGAGTIVVTVSSTDYLEDGDSVDIDGTSYTVSAVTGTTFEVSAASGAGWQKATWEPFGLVCENIPLIQIGYF